MSPAPRLEEALEALRQESGTPPRPEAMASARSALHRAVAARGRYLAPLGLRPVWRPLLSGLRRHVLLSVATGAAAAGAAVVGVAGWGAPPGSPFHDVRLARESVSVVLSSNATGLRLAYAEDRLREASSAHDPSGLLSEARQLLDEVHGELPSDAGNPLWARWSADERTLSGDLAAEQAATEHEATPSPGGGGAAPAAPSRAAPSRTTGSGEHGGRAPATATPTPSTDDEPGGGHGAPVGSPTPRPDG